MYVADDNFLKSCFANDICWKPCLIRNTIRGFATVLLVWPPLNSPTTKLITKPASMLSFNLLVNIPLNYIFSSPFLENGHSFNIYAAITKGRCTNFNLTLESCWLIARSSIHKLLLSLSNFSNNWQRVTNMVTNEFACRFYMGLHSSV